MTLNLMLILNCCYRCSADSDRVPQRIEVKIPWSKADKKAKGDCFTTVKYLLRESLNRIH